MTTIQDIATAEWLNQALNEAGLIDRGQVEQVTLHPQKLTFFSALKVASLHVQYTNNNISLSSDLILKIANKKKEYIFFSEISPVMENPEIIKCYYAEYDPENQQSYFLLEDVSRTHFQTAWPIPPLYNECVDTLDCLAKIHSYWWDHPSLEKDLLQKCEQGNYWMGRIDLALSNLPVFFDFMGDRLSKDRRQIYESTLSSGNQDWLPRHAKSGKTLLHGDAHFWNFLYPREKSAEHIRVIDWNSWDIGRATDDLAYMIGLHWYPERRKSFEVELLRHYHHRLQENGISYQWDEMWWDYRLSTIMNLFIPVWQWYRGINPIVWWSHMERSFLAYEDLNCVEMLKT